MAGGRGTVGTWGHGDIRPGVQMQQCQGNATHPQGTKEDAGSQQDLIPGTPTNLELGTRCGPDVPVWGPSSRLRHPTLLVDLAARVCVQGCHLSPAGVSALYWSALVLPAAHSQATDQTPRVLLLLPLLLG